MEKVGHYAWGHQWLLIRKSQKDQQWSAAWNSDEQLILNSSSAASYKFTMAAADQSIARVIFLVSINVVFLLAGLHVLHFRSKFHYIADCSPAGEFTISQHAAGSSSSSDDCTSDHHHNHNHTGASLNKKDITGQPYLMSHVNVKASHSALSSVDQVLQSGWQCTSS